MDSFFNYGPHTVFILLSYGLTLIGLGGLYVITAKGKRDTAKKIEDLRARVRPATKR